MGECAALGKAPRWQRRRRLHSARRRAGSAVHRMSTAMGRDSLCVGVPVGGDTLGWSAD